MRWCSARQYAAALPPPGDTANINRTRRYTTGGDSFAENRVAGAPENQEFSHLIGAAFAKLPRLQKL